MCTENEFMAAAWTAYSKTPHHLREDSTSSSNDWEDWAEEAFKQFYRFKWAVYWGRSFKGGFWRYFSTQKAAEAGVPSGYLTQVFVGVMQTLALDEKLVQRVSVVLWQSQFAEKNTHPDLEQQQWLELYFGVMLFGIGGEFAFCFQVDAVHTHTHTHTHLTLHLPPSLPKEHASTTSPRASTAFSTTPGRGFRTR
jgi:hypothetical protein